MPGLNPRPAANVQVPLLIDALSSAMSAELVAVVRTCSVACALSEISSALFKLRIACVPCVIRIVGLAAIEIVTSSAGPCSGRPGT